MSPDSSHSQFGISVGAKIRAARLAKKLTQSQLANPDFSVSYISAIERGQIHPSIRALEILAGRLSLSSTQLLPSPTPGDIGQMLSSGLLARGEDEIDLVLVEMQICIRQGAAGQAITQLQRLASKNLKRRQQVQVRYLLGWAYLNAGQSQEAEGALSEAVQLAKDLNSAYVSAHILNQLGLVYAAMRNYAQAIQTHQSCLQALESSQPRDPFFIAQIYANLGQHYMQLNKVDLAIEMLRGAIAVTEEHDSARQPQVTYWNICQYYADAKEYYLASLYAYKCLYLYSQRAYVLLRSEIYHYLYHALMKLDQEKARVQLDEVLQKASATQEPLVLASASTHLATWFFAHQALAEAEENARKASQLAASFGDTIIAAESLLMLGRIAYEKGQYQEGDAYFIAGLEMLERLEAHEELAEQCVHYAQLLEKHGKDREAFTYIRRAYESRQKISRSSNL